MSNELHKIHTADREANIYKLFFCAFETYTDLLIRAKHNRKLDGGSALWDSVGQQDAAVTMEVRYHNVEILRHKDSGGGYESVCMFAIELKQVSPKGEWQEESLHWKLLTIPSVNQVSKVLQCVKWYCYRWLIERFHYILKSGTQIEALQLKEAGSLQKAIHVYSTAAMRLTQLTYQPRQTPNVSCEVVLTKQQWAALYMLIHKTNIIPEHPPTLGEAVKWIERLSGHLGRKSDGPPGLKTVWRGYQRMCDAASVYGIMTPIWVKDSPRRGAGGEVAYLSITQ